MVVRRRVRAFLTVLTIAGLWSSSPALAQFVCTSNGDNKSCTNTGTSGSFTNSTAAGGTATTANSGTVNGNVNSQTNAGGDASLTNSGTIAQYAYAQTFAGGNATLTNSGTIGQYAYAQTFAGGNATLTNSGTIGQYAYAQTFVGGNASMTNSGTIGQYAYAQTFAGGNASLTSSGTIGAYAYAQTFAGGDVTMTNSGTIGQYAYAQTFAGGNASLTNSGTIGQYTYVQTFAGGNATLINSGTVAQYAQVQTFAGGNATMTNSGAIYQGAQLATFAGGSTSLTNLGLIVGGPNPAIQFSGGPDTLTNVVGSRVIGAINLVGVNDKVNFVGGNWLFTFNTLAGATINTNGAPFAVSGNRVAVLDPTVLALEDRSVMYFTGALSSMLQDRFKGMPVSGGGVGGISGFAPEATNRIGVAGEAFAGIPSLSMAYSSTGTNPSNANAMYAKAPALAVPVYDTVVWASGFGGERRQWENGSIQRATDTAYGGALGVDRQFTPDLRLGVFAGGGNSRLSVDFNIQRVDSDYVFGGGYGRWDKRNYYVDFALFGGGLSSNSTRQIANNTVANGLEIATAGYNGWFISPDVTYGYRIFMGDNVFTPKARVRYVGGTLDGFTEAGSAQGLTMGKRNLSDIEERLGVEFSNVRPVTLGGTLKTSVDVSGIALQRLGDNTIGAVLLAQNIAFTTPGSREAYGGVVNVGLDWRPKSNVSVYTSVEATAMSDKSFSAAGKGGIRIGF